MIKNLTCGIVIYDEVREIQNLIPKLKHELKSYDVEWIFVLNHEQEEIRKWIAKWIYSQTENSLCIENPSNNLGFARHLILEKSTNDYIYLTDPDIDIIPGNLKKLIQLANNEIMNDSNSKFIGYGGTVTHRSNNSFIQSTYDFMHGVTKLIPFSFQVQSHKYLVTVDHLPACHMLLNKNLALKIGGFSSGLKKCGEDLDFTHRAYNEDYRFVFLPAAEVIHWQNLSLSRWFMKIFTMGRVQIPVQKLNYKKGLRFYRLLPFTILISILVLAHFSLYFALALAITTGVLACFNKGILGFVLTFITYSVGELFEIFLPLFEQKNAEQLEQLNAHLKSQFYVANKENSNPVGTE